MNTKDNQSPIKYFILSALTTGILMLSISIIYGLTGSTSYEDIIFVNSYTACPSHYSTLGLIHQLPYYLMFITFLFKLGVAPLHNWAPDLYDSVTLMTTTWMMTIPKLGVLIFLTQIYNQFPLFFESNYAPHSLNTLGYFGVLSLFIGSIGLASQWKIKRFFAYSSISNLGYILINSPLSNAYQFYSAVYITTTLILFSILILYQNSLNRHLKYLSDLNGLYHSNPSLAFAFALTLFSMAGFPPFAGFYSKLLVFNYAVSAHHYFLTLALILASVIAATNYLTIFKISHLDTSSPSATLSNLATPHTGLGISYFSSIFITSFIGVFLILIFNLTNLFDFSITSALIS